MQRQRRNVDGSVEGEVELAQATNQRKRGALEM